MYSTYSREGVVLYGWRVGQGRVPTARSTPFTTCLGSTHPVEQFKNYLLRCCEFPAEAWTSS
ncbi:hypothetical protein J6590_051776 [Homalodisca vitripennis]|nr:hypothetical protein J6590_051776 [Homalodisca vitripennis]